MNNKYEISLTVEQFEEFKEFAFKALERIGKIVCGKNFSISNTAYANYWTNATNASFAVLMKLVVNILMCCKQHDQYCEMYDTERKTPKLRKHIEKGCIPRMKRGTPNVKRYQFRISDTIFTEYDLLKLLSLYPQAEDRNGEDRVATAVKMAITEIEFIANNSKLNAHNSGMGGKRGAMLYLSGITNLTAQHSVQPFDIAPKDFNGLNTDVIKCTTIVEAFGRTMAISLSFFNSFKDIYCGDTDFRFVNYYYVIEKWFDELIESVKAQFDKLVSSSDIQGEFKRLKELCDELKKKHEHGEAAFSKEERIAAAAALYVIINISFSGNEKNAVSSRVESFDKKFKRHISDLKYLSANMKKIKFVKRDFRKTIKKYINDPTVLLILDPPYLKEFGLLCEDYSNASTHKNKSKRKGEFTYEDMLDMFKLLKNAKCKVILFHSRSYWFDSTAVSYGLRKVGYYVGRNIGRTPKPYYTEVYCLNIDLSVKFFDPKNHGELYLRRWG